VRPSAAATSVDELRQLFVWWIDAKFVEQVVVEVVGCPGEVTRQLVEVGRIGIQLPGRWPGPDRLLGRGLTV
jgi:hypothetical protein